MNNRLYRSGVVFALLSDKFEIQMYPRIIKRKIGFGNYFSDRIPLILMLEFYPLNGPQRPPITNRGAIGED